MFEASAKKITGWMEKNQIIPPEKAVATQWGIWHLLSSGFSLLAFVVIGILMHMLPQTIVLNPRGEVTYNQVGSVTYEVLEELVQKALN